MMLKKEQLLQKTFCVAVCALMCMLLLYLGSGETVSAAQTVDREIQLERGKLTINTDTKKLIFTPSSDLSKGTYSELFFCVGTKIKNYKESKINVIKPNAWDVYELGKGQENNEIEIDLSKLSNAKDNYLMVKMDATDTEFMSHFCDERVLESVIIRIPAVERYTTAAYNPASKELVVKTGNNKKKLDDADFYEYRTANGSWKEGEELYDGRASDVFEEYQYQGAVLYVRTPGTSEAAIYDYVSRHEEETICELDMWEYVKDERDPLWEYSIYETDPFPGKEVKLIIAKQANPPVVKADYVNGTITIPKDAEYRIVVMNNKDEFQIGDMQFNKTGKAVVLDEKTLLNDNISIGTLEVRIPQNTAKKKAASKWTRILLVINVLSGYDAQLKKSDEGVHKSIYVNEYDSESKPLSLTAEYIKSKVNNVNVYNKVKLTNETYLTYEVIVVPEGDTLENVLKSSKNRKIIKARDDNKKLRQTLVLNNVQDQSTIYIRFAGNNKWKAWAGIFEEFGKVNYPEIE